MIQSELLEVVDKLKSSIKSNELETGNTGHNVYFKNYFTKGFLNLVSSLVTGERLPLDNPDLQMLVDASYKFLSVGHMGAGIISAWPFLRFVFPKALGYDRQMEAFHEKKEYGLVKTYI